MKRKLLVLTSAVLHKQAWSDAAVTAAVAGASMFTNFSWLQPEVVISSGFGAAYVYMNKPDVKRNRIFNLFASIILGVTGSYALALYLKVTYSLDGIFFNMFFAIVIAMAWPWVFEKYLAKK